MDIKNNVITRIFSKKIKEKGIKGLLFIAAIFGVIVIFSILIFLVLEANPLPTDIWSFISGDKWNPSGVTPSYGVLPLIVGTLLVTLGAMLIAVPLSLGAAIFISEIASPRIRSIIKPAIELLAGIPSVVYGFFGLIMLTEFIQENMNPTYGHGETWLAGSIILGIMAIPTITTVAEDAINSVPRDYKEGSLAMGATRWQTISKVVLPSALSGITAAIILGIGRAVGETMAVMMVCGNSPIIPEPISNIFSPIRTLTSTLGIEPLEVPFGSPWYHALFGVAVLLLIITLVVNVSAVFILGKIKAKHMALGKKREKKFSLLSSDWVNKFKRHFKYFMIGLLLLFIYFLTGLMTTIILFVGFLLFKYISGLISAKNKQRIAFISLTISVIIVLAMLGIILFYIISNGAGALSWEFLTQPASDLGRQGGVSTAIVGTLYLVLGAIAIALPIGVGAGVYLTEYKKEGKITKIIRTGADLLNGTPSIVFGLFGFAFFVLYLKFGFSLVAGQITLAFMIIPTILRTTEEALKSVPQSIREGSLALGATKWETVRRVVLPPAAPGILTGAVLGIGRAAGETAPIMLTAVTFSSIMPSSLTEPVNALPYHLFTLAANIPGPEAKAVAGGTALVLLFFVIGFYSVAMLLRSYYQKKMKW
jgi:phosphate transport system permease protein